MDLYLPQPPPPPPKGFTDREVLGEHRGTEQISNCSLHFTRIAVLIPHGESKNKEEVNKLQYAGR